MPIAYLCDFDGTISPRDIGAAFAERFSPAGASARVPELGEWLEGRIGHRTLTRAQCAHVRAREDEALAFTRGFRLDPRFAPFVREALGRGDAVMVVSEGFDFYLRDHLMREGLGDLPWAANHLVFREDGGVSPSSRSRIRPATTAATARRSMCVVIAAMATSPCSSAMVRATDMAHSPPMPCSRAVTCASGASSRASRTRP
jgi:hypothetical protein